MSHYSPPSRSRVDTIRKNLLGWYDVAKRDLPWRHNSDPYRVWISEVMLQQTRVEQARPFFERFITTFPTVEELANRDLDTVLKHWEGLGYYSRARNIHAAAQVVCENFGGRLPRQVEQLRKLPGIGSYTAGAIASIAFDQPEAAVDGNVVRVLSRLFALDVDTKDASARKGLEPLATTLVDRKRPGDFNQALMELGATVCTPNNPSCSICPLKRSCQARKNNRVDEYPRRVVRPKVPLVHQVAVVLIDEIGRVAVQKRSTTGMLGGLWEFPTADLDDDGTQNSSALNRTARTVTRRLQCDVVTEPVKIGVVRHAYSHFKILVTVYRVAVSAESRRSKSSSGRPQRCKVTGVTEIEWRSTDEIRLLALTGVTKRILGLF